MRSCREWIDVVTPGLRSRSGSDDRPPRAVLSRRHVIGAAVMPVAIILPPAASAVDALDIVFGRCLDHLAANAARAKASAPDALHQVRVAVRRLDAAVSLFAAIASGPAVAHIAQELKWIRRQMAAAREFDVFLDEVIAPLMKGKHQARAEVFQLRKKCMAQRRHAYLAAERALRSARFRGFLAFARKWTKAEVLRARAAGARARLPSAQELAATALVTLRKKIGKVRKLKTLEVRRLHRLRLRVKRMRYALEFFAGLYPGRQRRKAIAEMLDALERLQSTLGAINDADARREILDRLAGDDGPAGKSDVISLAGITSALDSAHADKLRAKAARAHAAFRDMGPFWAD